MFAVSGYIPGHHGAFLVIVAGNPASAPDISVAPIPGWSGNPEQSRGHWILPPSGSRPPGPLRCAGMLAVIVNGDSHGAMPGVGPESW